MRANAVDKSNSAASDQEGQLTVIGRRLVQSITLRGEGFAEVARDSSATFVAVAIVLLAALGTTIGTFSDGGFASLPGRVVVMFASWFAWTATVVLFPQLFNRSASIGWGTAGRAIALAHAPLALRALLALTTADILLALTLLMWQLAATYVAIRVVWPDMGRPAAWATLGTGFVAALLITGFTGLMFLN